MFFPAPDCLQPDTVNLGAFSSAARIGKNSSPQTRTDEIRTTVKRSADIFFWSDDLEMPQIATTSIETTVIELPAFRDRANGELVKRLMRVGAMSLHLKDWIAVNRCPSVRPAIIRAVSFDMIKEPFRYGLG